MKTITQLFRKLLLIVCSLFWLSGAQAQTYGENIFIIHDAVGKPDSTIAVYVEIINEDYFSTFIFDLPLPDGFTYTGPSWWNANFRGCYYTANVSIISGTNIFRFFAVNLTNCGFFGNRGLVASFFLDTPSQHGAYDLMPEDVIVWNLWGNLNIEILPVNFYITPEGPIPGDTNCDGLVNVNDVITAIHYILGNIPKPFCFANADLNHELEVDVTDVVGIIHIILQLE